MQVDPSPRGEQSHVPPERVMTRLMRGAPARSRGLWLEYLLLGIFIAGVLAGVFLATRG